ncbi:MAG: LuxR family transcriptional regulator [Pseudomonadota bacterium]|nr:LuxR family transcriptional regulator [Pseudomonadota bacterium]
MTPAQAAALEFLQAGPAAKNLEEFQGRFEAAIRHHGFSRYSYVRLAEHGKPITPQLAFGRGVEAWAAYYIEQGFGAHDPAMAGIFNNTRPFAWSDVRGQAQTPEARRVFAEAQQTGAREGLLVPIHGAAGELSSVLMMSEEPSFDPAARTTLHAMAMLYATLGLPLAEVEDDEPRPGPFTKRELECIQWVARGKSDWDASRIMGISESTVNMHVERIKRKLGVRNRPQMIYEMFRRGWLRPEDAY